MSQWTHCNGVIRFDTLMGMGAPNPLNLGEMSTWEVPADDTFIPCGSEGSLMYSIWRNPSTSSIASHTVSIFGDLRDYSDVDEILEYFTRITKDKMIRSGVLEIDVENQSCQVYKYDSDKLAWVKVG